MSIYANSSEQYWKKRRRSSVQFRRRVKLAFNSFFITLIALLFFLLFRNKSKSVANPPPIPIGRPNATDTQRKKCVSHFKTKQNECLLICNNERSSVPHPTMHQACVHGCSSSFLTSTEIGCHDGTNEHLLNNVESSAADHCSKYQNMIPKPELYFVCRKYHKMASEKGFQMGSQFITTELNKDGESTKQEQEV